MKHQKIVEESIKFIEEHLEDRLSTKIIAENAGYSVYYFGRIFKKVTGKNVMQYVREKRMEQAKGEIDDDNCIFLVAEKFGYATPSGFSRAYKKHFGETPSGREAK